MRILPLIILYLFNPVQDKISSPHGADFTVSCKVCHSAKGWQLDKEIYSFNHNSTLFHLTGEHNQVGCRQCHPTLVFKEAKTDCYSCHSDVHQGTTGSDCSRCHTTRSWLVENITEMHSMSRFPLEGAHKTAQCSDCHKSESLVRFDVPGINCIDCHRKDYQSAREPDHSQSGFPEDCLMCHKMNALQWSQSEFTHSAFPLDQGHSGVRCEACHTSGTYAMVGKDCFQCHKDDYNSAKTPDHSSSMLPTNCITCHTTARGWKASLFNHSAFPLTFGHAGPSCIECHTGGNYVNTNPDCFSCHKPDYNNSKNPNHKAAGFSSVCMTCHSTDPGWKPASFAHSSFPLQQAHSVPECNDCHLADNYTTLSPECYSCHTADYTTAANPDHSAAGFPKSCETCHSAIPGWKPALFNHNSFPLTQGHSTPLCSECHINGNFKNTDKDCNSCHNQDYIQTVNPKHVSAGFSTECLTCHSTIPGWKPVSFSHSMFPLTGGHSSSSCNDCHKGDNYTSLSSDCFSCHEQDYNSTDNPGHYAAMIPKDCRNCHTTGPGWSPATFTHSSFPLVQAHSSPTCIECHKGGNYTTTPSDCYSCHQTEFKSSTNPDHTAAAFGQTCETCHTLAPGWEPTNYVHSKFALTLGHSTPSCIECHKGNIYTGTPSECLLCHESDYTATLNPKHSAAGFNSSCQICHTARPGWRPTTYSHSSFPLTGSHISAACNDCHVNDNYTTVSTDCYSCHQQDYNLTSNPDHNAALFPHSCETCHSTSTGWKPTTFSHGAFPLTQGHATASCNDCHKAGNFTSTSPECYSCHKSDYDNSTDPKHEAAGFSQICTSCHTTNPGWQPATFSHTAAFALTLGHSGRRCIDCHTDENYTSMPNDCYGCHQPDFNAVADPNHIAGSFPQVCTICHNTNPGWAPTVYNHSSFPLTLGHATSQCADCHKAGNYTTISTDCYSCHQTNYTSTSNPSHVAAGFSQNCLSCHSTNPGWTPTTFAHSGFALTLGHATPQCTDCHIGENYTTTPSDCYSCHQTNFNSTTNPPHVTSGFPHDCLVCHTTNPGWNPATYDHTSFPLTLGHSTPSCADCHTGGNYTNTPTDCYSCHKNDYTGSINPSHTALSFSTLCTQCHTTNPGWQPVTFLQHDTQFFPVYSGKHRGQWSSCTDCHTNAADYNVFSCLICHEHNKNDMDDKHSGTPGYSYTSSACYQCHPNGRSD